MILVDVTTKAHFSPTIFLFIFFLFLIFELVLKPFSPFLFQKQANTKSFNQLSSCISKSTQKNIIPSLPPSLPIILSLFLYYSPSPSLNLSSLYSKFSFPLFPGSQLWTVCYSSEGNLKEYKVERCFSTWVSENTFSRASQVYLK